MRSPKRIIDYDTLFSELRNIGGTEAVLDEDETRSAFKAEFYGRGEFYVREGDVPDKIGFITEGLMKYYYIDADGNEWIKYFSAENDFVASYASFLYRIPSLYNIEALEDTIVLSIGFNLYAGNLSKSQSWGTIARKYTEKIYYEKEKREASFLTKSGSERYLDFLNEYGNLCSRITLKDTASFLGLTPVSLSRIRHKLRMKNR